jgi:hypothetical protein
MEMPVNPDETASDLIALRRFASEPEALVAAAALNAFAIDCTLFADDCGGQRPSLGWANGIQLLVRTGDVSQAEEVLANVAEPA